MMRVKGLKVRTFLWSPVAENAFGSLELDFVASVITRVFAIEVDVRLVAPSEVLE